MKKLLPILLILIASSIHSFASSDILITANISGAFAVPTPVVSTNARGVAGFLLNETRDSIFVNISVTGLSGPITGIHVHEGAIGVSGPIIYDLMPFMQGNFIKGYITGADLTPSKLKKYLTGAYYINVHTAANTVGELRGQLIVEKDKTYSDLLSGAKQIPAVVTNAYGLATFNLSKHEGKMQVNIIAQGLSGPITGADLNKGAIDTTGPVVFDFDTMVLGNTIYGIIDPTPFLSDLKAGNIYVNLHTSANPNGEIRGQLLLDNGITFDTWMNGNNQVPPVSNPSVGFAKLSLNNTFDTLRCIIVADSLSDTIVGAHFHYADASVNGPIVYDLTNDINGNKIEGMITGASLTDSLIINLLAGEIYTNIHTDSFPNGELRGQLHSLLREGYSYDLCGWQQVPTPVLLPGYGTGIVSVDRMETNAHYMVAFNNLSGTNQGSHFHNASQGTNGPVVYDILFNISNNAADAYWKENDPVTAFGPTFATKFRNGDMYLNIHTPNNPLGELRGQVVKHFICAPFLSVEEIGETTTLTAFPNPANNELNIRFNSNSKLGYSIVIYNLQGQQMMWKIIAPRTGDNIATFDISIFGKGMYFAKLNSADASSIYVKFVKE